MPNWSYNIVAFKGTEEKMLNLLNDALKNSNESKVDNINDAFNKLRLTARHKVSVYVESDDWQKRGVKTNVALKEGMSLRTFMPMPDTFLEYDTTNEPEKFPEVAAEQLEKYGAIGWYDYNYATLGTKWDSPINDFSMIENNGQYCIFLYCDTAWSMPFQFMENISEKYGIKSFICSHEESNLWCGYGDSEDFIVDKLAEFENLDKGVTPTIDEDYDAFMDNLSKLEDDFTHDMYDEFKDYVKYADIEE